jgi:hypothetical protein
MLSQDKEKLYEGEFKNGLKEGYGISTSKDEIYQGWWHLDKQHGLGSY